MEPERLGKYEIHGVLGKGAMGTVYAAWDPVISRKVAIKTVNLPDAADLEAQEELARFKREAQAAGRLTHPNIVGIFDYGETDTLAYIVMEFVDGQTLKAVTGADERMPVAAVGRIMADILAGLQYSHERGVVHRDIKPANVMLAAPANQAKIADFGIARIESSNLTQAGTIMGTPAYMSPEQFTGQTVDARTDIYSSGVLLFQLLTGERPFEGSMATIMHKALNTEPPKPSDISVTSPRALDAVVSRAMARRPDDRYDSATAFAEALAAALEGRTAAADPFDDADQTVVRTIAPRTSATPAASPAASPAAAQFAAAAAKSDTRRTRTPAIAVAAVVVLAAAGAGGWYALGGLGGVSPPGPSPTPAVTQTVDVPPSPVVGVTPPTIPQVQPQRADATPPIPPPSSSSPPASEPTPAAPSVTTAAAPSSPTRTPETRTPELPASETRAPEAASSQASAPATSPTVAAPATQPTVTAPVASTAAAPATPPTAAAPTAPLTTATPATPPAVTTLTAPEPPTVVAAAGVSAEATRRAVAAALDHADCAAVAGGLSDTGQLAVGGVIGGGDPTRALLARLREAAPNARLDWTAAEAVGPYCPVIDALRPFARKDSPVTLALRDGRTSFVADEQIEIHTVAPAYPSFMQVDYLSSDGSVSHIRDAQPGSPVAPRASQSVVAGAIAAPFGTDLLIAIASSTPLFTANEPLPETTQAYAPELQRALAAARAKGAHIEARLLVVHTAPKP